MAGNPLLSSEAKTLSGPAKVPAAVLQQVRHATFRQVVTDVRAGKITSKQASGKLKAAGFPDSRNPYAKAVTGPATLLSKAITEVTSAAINSPGGLYNLGKDLGKSVGQSIEHPLRVQTEKNSPFARDLVGMAKQTAADVRHPERHPGFFALDVAGGLSAGLGTVGRGAAAVGELRGAGTVASRVGKAAGALAKKPVPPPRTLKLNDLEVHPVASTNPLMRAAQGYHDTVIQKTGKAPVVARPFVRSTLEKRVGHELVQRGRIVDAAANAPATALHNLGSRGRVISRDWKARQAAMQLAAEGKLVADQIAYHKGRISELGNSPAAMIEKRRQAATVQLYTRAQKHLDESSGAPVVKPGPLADLYTRTKGVAKGESDLLQRIGALTPESAAERPHLPGRVVEGTHPAPAPHEAPTIPGQLSLVQDETAPGFRGGDFRVPSQAKRPPSSLRGAAGTTGGTVAFPKAPGSVTHAYKGVLKETAKERHDTARLVAESAIESNKYASKLNLWDNIKKAAVPVPPNFRDYVPVRLDLLKSGKMPQLVKDLEQLPQDSVARTALERVAQEGKLRSFVDELLPNIHGKQFDPAAQAALQKLHDDGRIAWVHHELADALRQQSPLAGMHGYLASKGPLVRGAAATVPTINRASKAAILYLKPAYAAPNILGNVALNLVQQGWAAPLNLRRAATLNSRMSPDAAATLDNVMGEGFAAALHDQSGQIGARAVNAMANLWGKGVDLPFRRASFLHEARRAGYRTDAQVETLLTDHAHLDELVQVAQRANHAIIDYGRLGPLEREIVRHVVFFYPWVKGSTMYAGHFLTEHPVQAAVNETAGQMQGDRNQQELGAGPSYTQGIFKVGGTDALPQIINPRSAAILSTPAELAQMGENLFRAHPQGPASLLQNLTPAVGAALAAFGTHRDPLTDRPLTGAPVGNFVKQLTQGLPQVVLSKRIQGAKADQSNRLFPMSRKTAVKQFLFGSAAPKPMNRDKYLALGEAEKRNAMARPDRIVYDHTKAAQTLTTLAQQKWPGILDKGKLPKPWQQAITLRQQRLLNLAQAGVKAGQPHYERDAYNADVTLLAKIGRISQAQARTALAWSAGQNDDTLKYQRMRLGRDLFNGGVLSYVKKALKERGADTSALPW